jgi:sialic acid synthase SpsE
MKTKIILEFGCNHQGDFNIAKQMIDEAYKLGVWGIKFQKRDIESMSEEEKNKPRSMSNSFGTTYYEHRKALEFTPKQLAELRDYCKTKNLRFVCTAFDLKSIYDLASINCHLIKLPSQLYRKERLKNALLSIRKKKGIKILVSTGMHTALEISTGLCTNFEIYNNSWIQQANIIFHCISVYPAPLQLINLSTLQRLKEIAKGKVGYSSHDLKGEGVKFAVLCGAEYIERHFTLDKTWKGSDHSTVSSDPPEVQKIIAGIEWAEKLLGDPERLCSPKEQKVRKVYRGF